MSLAGASFTWRATGDGRVLVSWQGRPVKTVTGDRARRLLEQLNAADSVQQQLLLARATGNFRRGTERR